jgi:hypothetical protein
MVTYANNKEDTSEHCRRHGAQNSQEGTGHGAPDRHSHQEVTNALLNNSCCLNLRMANLVTVHSLYNLEVCLIHCQRVCVYRRLWDKTVW